MRKNDLDFSPKKKGDRVYNGAYGNGTVKEVVNNRGRKRGIFIEKNEIYLDDPILVIKFDNHEELKESFDSDVGLLV